VPANVSTPAIRRALRDHEANDGQVPRHHAAIEQRVDARAQVEHRPQPALGGEQLRRRQPHDRVACVECAAVPRLQVGAQAGRGECAGERLLPGLRRHRSGGKRDLHAAIVACPAPQARRAARTALRILKLYFKILKCDTCPETSSRRC
jgi:hypothetical protein